jgi:hypothetical protein
MPALTARAIRGKIYRILPRRGAMANSSPGEAPPAAAAPALIRSLAWDIVLNTAIPLATYLLAKHVFAASDVAALITATGFPILKSLYDLREKRSLDPVAILVLLGITTSLVALSIGGDARMLLIRESLFTGVFGIACLVSLFFPRPIMFYFGRHFLAGNDPAKRAVFDQRWTVPAARRAHRLITTVWGLLYTGEFALRIALVYTLPIAAVLAVSPFLIGGATILAVAWTFRYAQRVRDRALQGTA